MTFLSLSKWILVAYGQLPFAFAVLVHANLEQRERIVDRSWLVARFLHADVAIGCEHDAASTFGERLLPGVAERPSETKVVRIGPAQRPGSRTAPCPDTSAAPSAAPSGPLSTIVVINRSRSSAVDHCLTVRLTVLFAARGDVAHVHGERRDLELLRPASGPTPASRSAWPSRPRPPSMSSSSSPDDLPAFVPASQGHRRPGPLEKA